MADEDRRYTTWIRTQPCAACQTELRIEPHHALYGTTYSPEETKPAKAIEGARKGMAQRSHDYFAIPMCMKCHVPGIHKLGGFFAGWTREAASAWEEKQVGIHRNRYAMRQPSRIPCSCRRLDGVCVCIVFDQGTATPSRTTRKRIGAGWTVATIRDWCRKEAPTRSAPAADALTELANLIEEDTL